MASFTFDQLVRDLRFLAGLTIDDLAALSEEGARLAALDGFANKLTEQPLDPLHRTTIIRFEAEDGVKRPQDDRLIVLAYTLALGLKNAGDDYDPDGIYNKLRASLRRIVTVEDVSREAATWDTVTSMIPEPYRSMLRESHIADAKKWRAMIREMGAKSQDGRINGDQDATIEE